MADPMTLAQEFAALNEATRRAHEAIADMRTERRLLADERKAAEAIRGEIRKMVLDNCGSLIGETVASQLDQFVPDMKEAMEKSKASVEEAFTRLENLYLGKTGPHTESIEDVVIEKIAKIIIARRKI
jgi:hypothetical protein